MIEILAHVTTQEAPLGVATFVAGMATGIAVSAAVFYKFFRSR